MLLQILITGSGGVTLSGGSFSATNSVANARVDFKVDQDGTTYEQENTGGYTSVNPDRDWLRPVSLAPGPYYVRYTNPVGDVGFLTATSAEDVWHEIAAADWIISVTETTNNSTKTVTMDIEIKRGASGATVATGSYTLTATKEDV